ncbi:MAG: hypothetical protein HZC36_13295 [Armatimonadetes bacterium]|nr:hypothetical protein [Armatimonadota bacterium]
MNRPFWVMLLPFLWVSALGETQGDSRAPALRQLPPGARVAVIADGSRGGHDVDLAVGDMLTAGLRQSGMRVIERMQLDAVLREQRLAREGIVDPSTAAPTGKLLGADYLMYVKATEFGVRDDRIGGAFGLGNLGGIQLRTSSARVVLDVRLIEVKSGSVVTTANGEGGQSSTGATLIGGTIANGRISLGAIDISKTEWSQSMLGKASRKAVESVVKKLAGRGLAPEGRVLALADGEILILDVGAFDGIRQGDRLTVFRLSSIKDSAGLAVWTEETALGEVRVVEVRGDKAKASLVGRWDRAAQEGDLAKRVRTP